MKGLILSFWWRILKIKFRVYVNFIKVNLCCIIICIHVLKQRWSHRTATFFLVRSYFCCLLYQLQVTLGINEWMWHFISRFSFTIFSHDSSNTPRHVFAPLDVSSWLETFSVVSPWVSPLWIRAKFLKNMTSTLTVPPMVQTHRATKSASWLLNTVELFYLYLLKMWSCTVCDLMILLFMLEIKSWKVRLSWGWGWTTKPVKQRLS